MKNYRFLVPIVLIVLLVASWYMLSSTYEEQGAQYNKYLENARRAAADGITPVAIENYNLAIGVQSSPELYAEVAEYYKMQERYGDYTEWCEDFFEEYPTSVLAFECVLDAYYIEEDYVDCYDVLYTAKKRNISSPKIEKISKEIEYEFKLDYNGYDDVGVFSSNYCAVMKNDTWGFVNRFGSRKISAQYFSVGEFSSSEYAPIVDKNGTAYFINKQGERILVSKEEYQSFGLLVNKRVSALKKNGKYTYLNDKLEPLFGEYDFASTFNGEIAAVMVGGYWQIIDSSGKSLSTQKYVDVKLDEKEIAYRNDRMFVATAKDKYIMIDGSGKQIGKQVYENAVVFAGSEPTSVKIDGKWCFIDKDGKRTSDKTYTNARSFSNGLAAVCIGEKWGFVDINENIVIDPQFYGAKDFTEKGSCFVNIGDKWKLLKLYRLNRED